MTIEIEGFDDLIKDPVKLKEAIAAKFEAEKTNYIKSYDIENDERVLGLKTKNNELLGKFKSFEGVDPEEYKRLKGLELNALKNTDPDEYLKVERDKFKTEYEKIIEERDAKIKTFEEEKNQYAAEKKRTAITDVFTSLTKTNDYSLKDASFKKEAALVSNLFTIDDKNEIVHKDGTLNPKTGKVYTLKDYVEDLKVNEAHLFDNKKQGSMSGLGVSSSVDQGFRKLTLQESIEMSRENPELYAQFKEKKLTATDW